MKNFKLIALMAACFLAGMWTASALREDGPRTSVAQHEDHADEHGDEHGADHETHGEHDGGAGHEGHEDDHDEAAEDRVTLSGEAQELAGIETAAVTQRSSARKISVTGRIAQDVDNVEHVFSPVSGAMKECFVELGQKVVTGDRLCLIRSAGGEDLEVQAPVSGMVMADFIDEGGRVDPTTSLHTIADVSVLPANFDVYEQDISHIQLNQRVLIYPLAYSGRVFEGRIVFISPRVDESTYTVKIKVAVENPDNLLKAGMFLKGEIVAGGEEGFLSVPASAVQTLGDKSVVFKRDGGGGFEAREIVVREPGKEFVAVEGLAEGDEIVVKGAFILKSKFLESEMEHAHSH
ncbi:MAG: efflux RND transporter periplasmic adaptor subunit [Candidatus Omnitrophota bacterium]|nr:efflux RND transporter periplasmic adaptor subunit [Candidatus Omnitrophota bacterium]MDZ4242679.1 efflux RND transporter periplasmic adaptor subunit [Candidatus Omnitrophota bacterium]